MWGEQIDAMVGGGGRRAAGGGVWSMVDAKQIIVTDDRQTDRQTIIKTISFVSSSPRCSCGVEVGSGRLSSVAISFLRRSVASIAN